MYAVPYNRRDLSKSNRRFIENNLERDLPELEKICNKAKNVLKRMESMEVESKSSHSEELVKE